MQHQQTPPTYVPPQYSQQAPPQYHQQQQQQAPPPTYQQPSYQAPSQSQQQFQQPPIVYQPPTYSATPNQPPMQHQAPPPQPPTMMYGTGPTTSATSYLPSNPGTSATPVPQQPQQHSAQTGAAGQNGLSNAFQVSDANVYSPPNATYVPPGTPLRGGMAPLYNPTEVRTFEAAPIFADTSMVQPQAHKTRAVDGGSIQGQSRTSRTSQAPSKRPPVPQRRRMMCC